MSELSQRARQILYACITEFVANGEPVGSRTLSKKGIPLSAASIRNVLSDLEEMGYLHQPHTSAGRIPTDRAFRLFIDAMMEVRVLSDAENTNLVMRFSEIEPGPNFLRETGRLLSELAGTAAVVVSPRADNMTLKHLRFIRTLPGEVLAVLVLTNGAVQNIFFKADVAEHELQKVHNLLPMKIFFVIAAFGLFFSTLTGLFMAYQYARNKFTVTVVLLSGIVVPLLLLLF